MNHSCVNRLSSLNHDDDNSENGNCQNLFFSKDEKTQQLRSSFGGMKVLLLMCS